MAANRLDDALVNCRQAVHQDPSSSRAYYLMGVVLDLRGSREEAKQALLRALQLDDHNRAAHLSLGKIYLESKHSMQAAKEFERAITLGDVSGQGAYGLGLALVSEHRDSEALPHLSAAVKAHPNDAGELFTLLSAELTLRRINEARRDLFRIDELSHADPQLRYRLGKLLLQNHLLDEAETEFQHAAANLRGLQATGSHAPNELKLSHVYLQIAQLRFNRRNYWGALEYFQKIETGILDRRLQAGALNLEGASLIALGKLDDARMCLAKATQLDPSKSEYFVHSAWADLLAGDKRAANTTMELVKKQWPGDPQVRQLRGILERERVPERANLPYLGAWRLQGTGFICCPCATPCPCRSNALPTDGHCEFAGAFRIARGHYGPVSLDGFIFAIADKGMDCQHVPPVLYVERSASNDQLVALERIFQSFDPSQPFVFLRVRREPISLVELPHQQLYEAEIPGILHAKIRRKLDAQGRPLLQTAAMDSLSNVIEYAQNLVDRVTDREAGLDWDYSGRQANFRIFAVNDRDYKLGRMLSEYADQTAFFNKRQLELIRELKLPMLPNYPNQPSSYPLRH